MAMNKDLITMNEVFNDGRAIFFYQHEETGIWVTYGYSAYNLAHIDNVDCISNYSDDMQMPCACITNTDFKNLVIAHMKTIEVKDGFYQLPMESKIESDSYQTWVNSIK